jgi:soluble lytic murein transglycosylase
VFRASSVKVLFFIFIFFGIGATPSDAGTALSSTNLAGGNLEHVRAAFRSADHQEWENAFIHVNAVSNPALEKLITWEYILDSDSGASFDEITQFIKNNPTWPELKKTRLRAEMSLRNSNVSDRAVMEWFGSESPITGVGKIALAKAFQHTKTGGQEKIDALIRDAWKNGDFEAPEEKNLLETYGKTLRQEDHIARIDRLLWEEKVTIAKRVLKLVPASYQKLFKARMALIDDKRLAVLAVAQVPSSLKNDPGLIYDRMRYRASRDDDSGVRQLLLAAPTHPPYPEKWWGKREFQIRKAIGEKKYDVAKKLLGNHGQVDGSELADAIWLGGWLDCEFMGQPKDALRAFTDMYGKVRYPVSKARAAYWAGRAAEKSGDTAAASHWYDLAVAYPTTFYGQLASIKKSGNSSLHIPALPEITAQARSDFENQDLVKAIKLCIEMNEPGLARQIITSRVENSRDAIEIAMLSELGGKTEYKHLSVHASKKALQQNLVLINAGYPHPETPKNTGVERPFTLAIVRQESEFDPRAKSPSNAVGMMQLVPKTAKEMARRNHLGFAKERLLDENYNMMLGSLYLGRLIRAYDGSYVMAIAAYNAGPGNVRNWIQQFGAPGKTIDNAVDWIEKIPYQETRNYVHRVLENLQVYRYIEANNGSAALKLGEDLTRQ